MRVSRLVACLFALTLAVGFAPHAYADDAPKCECFCTSKAGAVSKGKMIDVETCDAACGSTQSSRMIICAKSVNEYPSNQPRCFNDADQCKLNCSSPSGTGGFYFDDPKSHPTAQPPECLKGQGYCYCTGQPYSLQISIGGTTSVKDIGDYVQVAYKFLLGFSVTVAIVFIMIGGAQYVLAAGTGNTKAGKEKIQNAVVGLVLLFSSALILQSVNPRLLSLQPPRLPTIKRIDIIKSGVDCDALAAQSPNIQIEGYVANSPCGTKAKVLTDKNGSALPDGTTCTYRHCNDNTQGCFINGQGEGKCMKCVEAVPTNDIAGGIVPTGAVCAQLQRQPTLDTEHPYCFWSQEPYLLFGATGTSIWTTLKGAAGAGVGAAVGSFLPFPGASVLGAAAGLSQTDAYKLKAGTCSELVVACGSMSQPTCEGYNDLQASNTLGGNTKLSNISPGWGEVDMQSICTSNPCKWNKNNGGCIYVPEKNNCITPIVGQGSSGDHCSDDAQCTSGICNKGGLYSQCAAPGGDATGTKCKRDQDCASHSCTGGGTFTDGTCAAGSAAQCSTNTCQRDTDCCSNVPLCDTGGNNPVCVGFNFGPTGFGCTRNSECASSQCVSNKCK